MDFLLAPSPSSVPFSAFSAFSFQPVSTEGAIDISDTLLNAPGRPIGGVTCNLGPRRLASPSAFPQKVYPPETCSYDPLLQTSLNLHPCSPAPFPSRMEYLQMPINLPQHAFPTQLASLPGDLAARKALNTKALKSPLLLQQPKREPQHDLERDHSTSSDLQPSPPTKRHTDEMVRRIVPRITGNDHTCKVCQRALATRQQLKQHIVTEHVTFDEDKPFVCPTCKLAFKRIAHLHRHQIVHNGSRTFECPKCDKTFARNDHLTAHLWTHETGPFICHVCQHKAQSRAELKMHSTNEHPLRKRRHHQHGDDHSDKSDSHSFGASTDENGSS